jgi:hypothetical protein
MIDVDHDAIESVYMAAAKKLGIKHKKAWGPHPLQARLADFVRNNKDIDLRKWRQQERERRKKAEEEDYVGLSTPSWFLKGRLYPDQPCCEEGTCGDQNSK